MHILADESHCGRESEIPAFLIHLTGAWLLQEMQPISRKETVPSKTGGVQMAEKLKNMLWNGHIEIVRKNK